jgi:DNA repair protein SbcD/Mre11
MRIIHTADWHLCDKIGRIDRTPDLEARVETVARLCLEHGIDVLLIAGDLFSEQASVEEMTRALNHLQRTFVPFFARGGTILTVTGNHDHDRRINMVRAGMTLAAPDAGKDGVLPPGRMYLVNGRAIAQLKAADGSRVQFVLVPYPFASRYDLAAGDYRSKEEENRLLHRSVADWIRHAPNKPNFDVTLPTILAAHLHVRGSELHTLYKLTERDDVCFDFADLNPMWAYVALGHIHKPQALGGAMNVRYSGSLDRLDFGDTHDDHGVLLLEVDGSKSVEPRRLSIPGTPFHTVSLSAPEEELSTLADRYPDRETALVRFHLAPPSGTASRDEIARQLRKLFPRWCELKWADAHAADDPEPTTFAVRAGFETTVRDYLNDKLAGDADREAVLALAETFLTEARTA